MRSLSFTQLSPEQFRHWEDFLEFLVIKRAELESCLISRSTFSSLVTEYDLWVREMTLYGLDFRNPVGHDTFACFKRICIIGRNMNESSGEDVISKDVQSLKIKKNY